MRAEQANAKSWKIMEFSRRTVAPSKGPVLTPQAAAKNIFCASWLVCCVAKMTKPHPKATFASLQ